MNKKITFEGKPLTLTGRSLKIGEKIPNFKIVDSELNEIEFNELENKNYIIISFPSLDTPVCELQVKEFNERAKKMSSEVEVIGISKDLPFAQSRFIEDNKINDLKLFSDYKYNSFSENCGLLIQELQLTARSVIITDKNKTIKYIQIVDEITDQPDYDEVMQIVKKIISENDE